MSQYVIHDQLYREMRHRQGAVGWQNDYTEHQSQIQTALDGPYAPSRGSLLELGCGAGNMTIWMAQNGYECAGIDIADTAIDWARNNAVDAGVDANFKVASLTDIPFDDGAFDFVLDGNAFHCIIGDDRARVLQEVVRILKPGGYFLVRTVCTPIKESDLNPAYPYDATTRISYLGDVPFRYLVEP
ncbi:MAG: class I SAM-dependent methyltransferase, partial [Pseudomonadota bacterium]